MRALLIAVALLLPSTANAAELSADIMSDNAFLTCYASLGDMVKADKRYKRIPLDTEAQANAFTTQLHKLYRGQINDVAFYA